MSLRTQLYSQMPWVGGMNTSLDPSAIPDNQLVRAENVVFGVRGSRGKRDGINYHWDDASNASETVIGLFDFWYGTGAGKTQKLVGLTTGKKIYSYNITTGARSADLFGGTAWSSSITDASFATISNKLLLAVDGSGNVMKKWTGSGNFANLGVNVTTGDTSNGSPTVSNVASYIGVEVGAAVTGTGIPANTLVTGINASTITLNNNATATNTGTTLTFTFTPPAATIIRTHQGRVFANDKTNVDRLHYCPIGNPEVWGGWGDSGAIDIGVGDGDPAGITAIFPTFKGDLFIAKQTKLYRLSGASPDEYSIELVSSGVGCISHNSALLVDQDDLFFASEKGIHSMASTLNFGDFQSSYVSLDIQKTYNVDVANSRKSHIKGAYVSNLNSVAFAIPDERYGTGSNNAILLYNLPLKSWYLWPNVSCEAMALVTDSDQKRLYIGNTSARVGKTLNGTDYDLDTAGAHQPISYTIRTGLIFTDKNPYTVKGFKKFSLIYQPSGDTLVTVTVKIDNYPSQTLTFTASSASDLLGSTFILGSSVLSSEFVLAPYTQSIDGFGHGVQITIQQTSNDQRVEIQGFAIEYEVAGTQQEVVLGNAGTN